MQTIYLVRHGLKEPMIGDPSLTEAGQRQAQLTATHLKKFPISLVVSSPMRRTQQTATHIARELKLPITTSELLKERANWGDDPHQSFEAFLAEWTKASQDRNFQPTVGDSSEVAGKRLEQQIASLIDQEHSHIVLVTHGGIIGDFLRNIFGDQQLEKLVTEFPNGKDFRIDECSITEIQIDNQSFKLARLADTNHLT